MNTFLGSTRYARAGQSMLFSIHVRTPVVLYMSKRIRLSIECGKIQKHHLRIPSLCYLISSNKVDFSFPNLYSNCQAVIHALPVQAYAVEAGMRLGSIVAHGSDDNMIRCNTQVHQLVA